jgi:hypothetical protein
MSREDEFYIKDLSTCEKLDILGQRLDIIRQRLEDVSYDISQKELMDR